MSAISAMNGVPSAASKTMLTDVLRGEWGFDGFVTSDCDTISAISQNFHYTATVVQATAAALKAGGDINCGPEYALLLNATADGFVTEDEIDVSVRRALRRRVQVGDLDPPGHAGPYDSIPLSVMDSAPHKKLAHDVALESVVLLRNPDDVLPLDRSKLSTVLVVGPSADDIAIQAHTYHGNPSKWITIYDAVVASVGAGVEVKLLPGCSRTSSDRSGFAAALAAAALADAVIYVGGLEASMEEEGTDRIGSIGLPGVQLELIQALEGATRPRSTPLVTVIVSGGPVVDPWMAASKAGWLWLSYFGQDGSGVGEIIFGDASPSGRLPFTMPSDAASFGDITDYSMTSGPHGRTYRYWRYDSPGSWPVFPFAYVVSAWELILTVLGDPVLTPPAVRRGAPS